MSDIRAGTISDAAGTGPITMTKQSPAKAYGMYSLIGTAALYESLNISSLTDSGLGYATLTLTNAMATTGASIPAGNGGGGGNYLCDSISQSSASAYVHLTQYVPSSTWYDAPMHSHVNGDLA